MAGQTLDELFVAHRQKLVWSVFRIVRCSETAEDLVHEAYLRVSAALCERPVGTIRPFLYRTARNLAIDHVRGRRIRNRIVAAADTDLLNGVASLMPSPERQALDRQRLGQLQAALAGMSARRREILVRSRLHGWSYERIAGHFGLSESAVQKNIRVALAQCLAAMTEKDEPQV
ncbi:MAG: sigma-70 family RNA polymerase sigma factor [Alphaproteobacteria bacterium]|nr:sigma-70 family RNA polymerase sigma factor [Alphaproteobacteria bacterium]